MNKIQGYFHFSSTNFDEFNKMFENNFIKLQNDGQYVEVKYKTNIINNKICYSCLLIGRK